MVQCSPMMAPTPIALATSRGARRRRLGRVKANHTAINKPAIKVLQNTTTGASICIMGPRMPVRAKRKTRTWNWARGGSKEW